MQPGPELWPPLVPRLRLSISRANAPGRSGREKKILQNRAREKASFGWRPTEAPVLSGFPPPPPLSPSLFHEIDRREKWRGGREREAGITGGGEERRRRLFLEREKRGEGGIEKVDRKETSPSLPLFGVSSCRRRLYRAGGREDSAAFQAASEPGE